MKLTEMKNEQALDALEMLIDPVSEICTTEFMNCLRSGNMAAAVKVALKQNKAALIRILAVMDCEDPDTYSVNMFQIIRKAIAMLNDPEVIGLFTSAPQTEDEEPSGDASAVENANEA